MEFDSLPLGISFENANISAKQYTLTQFELVYQKFSLIYIFTEI